MLLGDSRSLGYWFALPKFSLLLFMTMVLSLGVQAYAVNTFTITKSPFESGYDHGCNDAGITDLSDRYINQPGKDPSFHTEEFMRGYDTGYNACSNAME
jgi:hypothetical protein